MHLRLGTAAVVTAALLLVTACGSSKDSGSRSASTTSTIKPPSSTEPFPTTTAPVAPSPFVTLSGYGPLHFGMTVDQASAAVGATLTTEAAGVPQCVTSSVSGISLYFIDRTLAVMDPSSSKVRTSGNLAVGSTKDDVEQALAGHLTETPGKANNMDGTELYYRTPDPATAGNEIDFSITNGKVSYIVAGLKEDAEHDEMCS